MPAYISAERASLNFWPADSALSLDTQRSNDPSHSQCVAIIAAADAPGLLLTAVGWTPLPAHPIAPVCKSRAQAAVFIELLYNFEKSCSSSVTAVQCFALSGRSRLAGNHNKRQVDEMQLG